MSEPYLDATDPLRGAISEAISAMSALNMYPDPKPADEVKLDESGQAYLSETDRWASHAVEHLHGVCELLIRADSERERDRDTIRHLRIEALQKRDARRDTVEVPRFSWMRICSQLVELHRFRTDAEEKCHEALATCACGVAQDYRAMCEAGGG